MPFLWYECKICLNDDKDRRENSEAELLVCLFVFALDKPVGQRGMGSWSGVDGNQEQSGYRHFVLQSEQQRQNFISIKFLIMLL